MRSKQRKSLFNDQPSEEKQTPQEWYTQSLGVAGVDQNSQKAEALSITLIHPDPIQPRRSIPSVVRRGSRLDARSVGSLFNRWFALAQEESGIDCQAVFQASRGYGDPVELPDNIKDYPITSSLLELIALAADIYQRGLTNAITVARRGREFLIETGERRWLAHHLIYALTGDDRWSKMAARIVEHDIWRQASENNIRANLNAIGKARQFALLLMDVCEPKEPFKALDDLVGAGECDQPFYAQAEPLRVPYGTSQKFLDALGEKNAQRLVEYRRLLRISTEMWEQADDEDWALDRVMKALRPEQESDGTVPIDQEESNGTVGFSEEKVTALTDYPNVFNIGDKVRLPSGIRAYEVRAVFWSGEHQIWKYRLDDDTIVQEYHLRLDALNTSANDAQEQPSAAPEPDWNAVSAQTQKELDDVRLREKINAAIKRGEIDEAQGDLRQWVELSSDPHDPRIRMVNSVEIIGVPKPRPVDQPQYVPTPGKVRSKEENNRDWAGRRSQSVISAINEFMNQRDITICDALSAESQVHLRGVIENVIIHSINLWMQTIYWPELEYPGNLFDAFNKVNDVFQEPQDWE